MHEHEMLHVWEHDHNYLTASHSRAERNTWRVIALTAVMMVVEVVAGTMLGSMALLADGWHMASHAAALGISLFAYAFARRHASDARFSFGTGKVGALGGFASAVALGLVALWMLFECAARLVAPVEIQYGQALFVAALGRAVNVASAWLLHGGEGARHADGAHPHEHDHNLRAAYVHVLADALTSVLAIAGLVAGSALGWMRMDPLVGLAASLLVARWAIGLLRETACVLLDVEAGASTARDIRARVEREEGTRVVDLHIWSIAPRSLAAIISIVTPEPRAPEHYKELVAGCGGLVHVTVEVNRCCEGAEAAASAQ